MNIEENRSETIIVFKLIYQGEKKGEFYISGSNKELGEWDFQRAVQLINSEKYPNIFKATIKVPEKSYFEYKYYFKSGSNAEKPESLRNRRITAKGFKLLVDDGHFCSVSQSVEEFSSQWLGTSSEIRILFGRPSPPHSRGELFHFYGEEEKITSIKFHTTKEENIIRKLNFSNHKQVIKNQLDLTNNKPQDQFEEFTIRSKNIENIRLAFSFFLNTNSNSNLSELQENLTPIEYGRSFLTYSLVSNKCGTLSLPILSNSNEILAEFQIEYLIVTPFLHPTLQQIQNASTRAFWKSTEYLYCGHRGMGANNATSLSGKKTTINENTILSFNTAAKIGTQYVEFDVQLTKDKIPIVFHDFSIGVPTKQKDTLKIPISSLTLRELQQLFVNPLTLKKTQSNRDKDENNNNHHHKNSRDDNKVKEKHFHHGLSYAPSNLLHDGSPPSLDDVFRLVNPNIGFNIEVKYPSDDEKSLECPTVHERNLFVDKILDVVHAHFPTGRNLFFSSFDPQTCIMLSSKQPHYPVFFLTEAGTEITCDPRRNSLEAAAHFAKSQHLLGIVSNVNPILKDPSIISTIKSEGLMLITYGRENNEIENIRIQEEHDIDAIISDFLLNPRGYFPTFQHQASSSSIHLKNKSP